MSHDSSSRCERIETIVDMLATLPPEVVEQLVCQWEKMVLENGWLPEDWNCADSDDFNNPVSEQLP